MRSYLREAVRNIYPSESLIWFIVGLHKKYFLVYTINLLKHGVCSNYAISWSVNVFFFQKNIMSDHILISGYLVGVLSVRYVSSVVIKAPYHTNALYFRQHTFGRLENYSKPHIIYFLYFSDIKACIRTTRNFSRRHD